MEYKVTFLNGDDEVKETGLRHLDYFLKDIICFMDDLEGNEDLGPFNEYGLCFDYTGEYWRFQLSYGGPSTEVRFYEHKNTEFVFLNWGVGVGFDIADTKEAKWLVDYFRELDMFQYAKEQYQK